MSQVLGGQEHPWSRTYCGFMEGTAVPQARVQAFHAGAAVKEAGTRRDGEGP